MIRCALDKGVVIRMTCKDWYNRFHEEDFKFKDRKYFDQSQKLKDENSIYWIKIRLE